MRALALLVLGLLAAPPAWAAPTLVQSTALIYVDGGTSGSGTFPASVTQGNQVVITASTSNSTSGDPTCAFTLNGLPTSGVTSGVGGINRAHVALYPITTAIPGTVTVSVTCQSTTWVTMRADEWSGLLPGVLVDAQGTGFGNSPTCTGSTGQFADVLALAVLAEDVPGTATITPAAGWTQAWEQENCVVHQCGSVVSSTLSSAGAWAHQWTLAQAANYATLAVALPVASGSGGGGSQPIARLVRWTDNQPDTVNAEDGFRIQKRSDLSAPNWLDWGQVGRNVTQFASTSLPSETSLCARAQAFNAGGSSAYAEGCLAVQAPATCALPVPGTAIVRQLLGAHATNPRYFTDSNGCPIYLTGSHVWWSLQDGDGNTFDWTAYRSLLATSKHNLARLWISQSPYGNLNFPAPGFNGATPWYNAMAPTPYGRHASTCCAADGGNKFDLDTWNSAFWTRLNDRLHDLNADGVYGLVLAFNRYDADDAFAGRSVWPYHPYNASNNVNSVEGDANGNGNGEELFALGAGSSASVPAHTIVSGSGASSYVTPSLSLNAGDALVACPTWTDTATFSSLSLSGGGTWTQVGSESTGAAASRQRMYLLENANAGSQTVTVNISNNAELTMPVVVLRGVPTSGLLDQQAVQGDNTSPFDTPQVTTTQASEIAVVCSAANTSSATFTHTAGNSFTVQEAQNDGSANWVVSLQTRLLSSTATLNGSTTYGGGTVNSTAQRIATFRANTTGGSAVNTRQRAFLAKLCDEICDEPNALVELLNESNGPADWQYEMIAHWQAYCLTKTYCPPIGMTNVGSQYSDAQLLGNPGKWYGPSAAASGYDSPVEPYNSNMPVAGGARVAVLDSDHTGYMLFRDNAAFARAWVWKSFTRGYNPILMEDAQTFSGWLAARAAMGQTRTYADKIALGSMPPSTTLCSTQYCLMGPTEALVYQPSGGAFTVSLAAGDYGVEWFNPASGAISTAGTLAATGGDQTMTPPFAGEAVLWLKRVTGGGGGTPPPPPVGLSIATVTDLLEEELL